MFLLQNQTRLLYDQLTEKKAALQQCLNELHGHNVSEQLQVILFEGNESFYKISYFQFSAICEVLYFLKFESNLGFYNGKRREFSICYIHHHPFSFFFFKLHPNP